MTFSCDAQSPSDNNATHTSPLSTAITNIKNDTKRQISFYDEAVHKLNEMSANALGFYTSTVEQADGSKIEYMHESLHLEDSYHAYKMTSEGFFIGSRKNLMDEFTWEGKVDMSANAVFRYLVAEGIDADIINVTNLVVGKNVLMGDDATISWGKIDGKPENIITNGNKSTYITKSYVESLKIIAEDVNATSFYGKNYYVGYGNTNGAIYQYAGNTSDLRGRWDYNGLELYYQSGSTKTTTKLNAQADSSQAYARGFSMEINGFSYYRTDGYYGSGLSTLTIENLGNTAIIDFKESLYSPNTKPKLTIGGKTKNIGIGARSSPQYTQSISLDTAYSSIYLGAGDWGYDTYINTTGDLYISSSKTYVESNGIDRECFTGSFTISGTTYYVKNGLIYKL